MARFSLLVSAFASLEETTRRTAMAGILADLFRQLEPADVRPSTYLLQGRLGPQFDSPDVGISEKLTARALAAWSGETLERIERDYRKRGDYGSVAEHLLRRRRAGSRKPHSAREGLSIRGVFDDLLALAKMSGAGSVQGKIDALVALLRRATPIEAKYLLRIPMGPLRLGVGDATIMDALAAVPQSKVPLRPVIEQAYNLCSDLGLVATTLYRSGPAALAKFKVQAGRPIKMQFAERVKDIGDIVRRLGRCAVEPKYDGFRCQVHRAGSRVWIFSRNQEDNTSMFPDIVRAVTTQVRPSRAIFEGEALAWDADSETFFPFQVTVQRKRTHGVDAAQAAHPLRLNVFDVLYLDGEDLTGRPYQERRAILKKMIRKGSGLAVAPALVSDDVDEIRRFFEAQIADGLEGIVAKRLDGPYEAGKRNFNWIKFKRAYHGSLEDTVDLAIVGYFPGRGARAKLGIGAVLGAVYDKTHDRFRTLAKVASGLRDADWIALRRQLETRRIPHRHARVDSRIEAPYWVEPAIVLEVLADELTRSPLHTAGMGTDEQGSGFAMRFPRIVRGIRKDRLPEDATTEREIIRMFKLQRRATRRQGPI